MLTLSSLEQFLYFSQRCSKIPVCYCGEWGGVGGGLLVTLILPLVLNRYEMEHPLSVI